jgi:Kef-type K+ transport system membrane component KefB
MNAVPETVQVAVALVLGAIIVFAAAVWFGQRILAPRIGRAADRADADEEEPGDRPD